MNFRTLLTLLVAGIMMGRAAVHAGDSVVVVNEVHYNPANPALEFVELHNQLSVNVDMSGWRFDGGITFQFPEGTVIPARGYLVVAANPGALQTATGIAGALGPFTGALSNDGETLKLWNNNAALRTRPNPPAPPAANELWSVDIQGDGNGGAFGQPAPTLMSGAESISGFGNVWNAFTIRSHDATSVNPSLANLKDSGGATTGIGFSITGTVSAFNTSPGDPLRCEYLFLAAGNSAASITWRLTGLDPAKTYSLWLYGSSARSVRMKVDLNGNGSLTDDTAVTAGIGGGVLVSGIHPSSAGRILGNADTPGGETNWSGFQLFIPPPPGEPAPIVPGNYSTSLERRRLMDEFVYSDSGKWPVAPDGSGFTLSKIDPQGGGAATNWAWSLGVNGTPGSANFPAGSAWNATLPTVAFNEVSGANDTVFKVELFNFGANATALTDWLLVNGDTGASYTFPATTIAPGGYLVLNETALGFRPANNARLFLRGGTQLIDAVKVAGMSRARQTSGTGRWLRPNAATFGSVNTFSLATGIVFNEIFHRAFDDSAEEWLELKNRSGADIVLDGWRISDGISFTFPSGTTLAAGQLLVVSNNSAALLAKYPGRRIIGNFTSNLGGSDSLTLEDANGNPADEVAYEDSGRWSELADGGGASLELRDAKSDNSVPEAWAASATAQLGTWQTISYTETATDNGQGFDAFDEFLLGLLDSGEVLIDNVSVRENPETTNVEFIQNGSFDSDAIGAAPLKWRLLGTHFLHGRTMVVADPADAGNKCLRVVATGHTDDKHNRIETTFVPGQKVTVGNSYKISFRARWVAGSNAVNTRLYFDYLTRTSALSVGTQWGTPGLPNSMAVANDGPAVSAVSHAPAVPAANVQTAVSAVLDDVDGIEGAAVFFRVNAGAWQSAPLAATGGARYAGTIPGQPAGALVQFYISAADTAGAKTSWPAAGAKGGAFFRVNDGNADVSGLRGNLRILVSPENEAALFLNTNRMSNHLFPGTVIEDERIVYYQCGIGLKGSAAGRFAGSEFGYSIDFLPEQPFRGVHTSVSIERAGNLKEIVAKHLLNRAGGGYWSQYDDVAKVVGPGGVNAPALIAAARTTNVFLRSLFPDESVGPIYNHELLYQPNGTTDGNPESLKLNNPYNHNRAGYDLADRGPDKEQYRWGWQLRNQRKADDYSTIIRINRAFGLTGSAFDDEIEATIDIDQWMRTWAIMGLYGNDDQYGRLFPHNWRLYARPTDRRLIALPWDLDRAFNLSPNASLTPTTDINGSFQNIQRLFENVDWKRQFDSHVLDLVNTTFNSTYMATWIDHLASVTGESGEFGDLTGYISGRSTYALSQLPAATPFAITTNGGADFTTASNAAALEGTGWADVYTITRTGQETPFAITWLTATTWRIEVPLVAGENTIVLEARDQHGTLTGTDSITITSSTANVSANAANIVISEIHYRPAVPTHAEVAAGFDNEDAFQFIELYNRSLANVELAGSTFTAGIGYNFTASTIVAPGGVVVLAKNPAAFQARYGVAASGEFSASLAHSGETLSLTSASGAAIASFAYSATDPWPASASSDGYSLQLIRPKTAPNPVQPVNWTSSAIRGGSPGVIEDITYDVWLQSHPDLTLTDLSDDQDQDGLTNDLEYAMRTDPLVSSTDLTPQTSLETLTIDSVTAKYFVLHFRRHIGATSGTWQPQFSPTLSPWQPAPFTLLGSSNNGDGTETVSFRTTNPAAANGFGALQVTVDP